MTAADHANTVRDALRDLYAADGEVDATWEGEYREALAALDALEAQAEQEHREKMNYMREKMNYRCWYYQAVFERNAAEAERDRHSKIADELALVTIPAITKKLQEIADDRDRLADALREDEKDAGLIVALMQEESPQSRLAWQIVDRARAALAQEEDTPEPPPWTTMHDGALDAATRARTEHTPPPPRPLIDKPPATEGRGI